MTKHDRSDEKVCETSPYRQAPCRRLLVCCPENHLPSINWETKLGKQVQFASARGAWSSCSAGQLDAAASRGVRLGFRGRQLTRGGRAQAGCA